MTQTKTILRYDTRTMRQTGTITVPGTFDWTGNEPFVEGRTHVSADGRLLFSTLDNGVFYTTLGGEQ
jgi:hypothetical protein